jgi:hypothetical protein
MNTNTGRETLLLGGIVTWILFVLGGYYYFHKPVTIEMIAAPAQGALDLLLACWITALAGGLGRRLLPAREVSAFERAALQYALGCGLLGLAWFAMSLLGLLRLPLWLLLLAGTLLLFRDVRGWLGEFRELAASWRTTPAVEKLLALTVAVFLLFQLFVALAPPLKWDALTYHLQLPRQYLAAGRLVFIPENPYWGHPQLVEMLYTLAMSLHRAETAAVLGWNAGLVGLAGMFGFTNAQVSRLRPEQTGTGAGWAAVAATAAGSTFRSLFGWSYTELFSVVFGMAVLVTFFRWLDTRRAGWFLWACLFCGLAMGTKWTAGVAAAGVFLAALVFTRRNRLAFKDLLLRLWLPGGAIFLAAILPWLVKNTLATGSPIYPYFVGTPWFDSARLASANPPAQTIDWWLHLLLPVSTTWAGIDSAPGFSTDVGPLLLLFAAIGLWHYRRDPGVQAGAILLVPAALAIGVAGLRLGHLMQTRLYFVLLPVGAWLAGLGWAWCQPLVLQGVRLRRILAAIVFLVLGLALWQDAWWIGWTTPGRVFQGVQTCQSYLENTLGFHVPAMQEIAALPEEARILMLWEPRGFYAPLNAQADLWIDRWRTDRRELETAQAILARWKSQGFTHLLVYQPGVELIRPPTGQPPGADWTILQETLRQLPEPLSIGGEYALYELK